MQHLDTYFRFQEAFARTSNDKEPMKGDNKDRRPPDSHADPRVRKAVYEALKAIHRHVFENENVKHLATAKERHAAIVALSEPERDDGKR